MATDAHPKELAADLAETGSIMPDSNLTILINGQRLNYSQRMVVIAALCSFSDALKDEEYIKDLEQLGLSYREHISSVLKIIKQEADT